MSNTKVVKTALPKKSADFILNKLIPFILREQGNGFIMEDWVVGIFEHSDVKEVGELFYFDGIKHKVPKCETVACIGGSVEFLKNKKDRDACHQNDKFCADVLGLSLLQAKGLFYQWDGDYTNYGFAWPPEYVSKFEDAKTPLAKAKVAVSLLKLIVKRGGDVLAEHYGKE